MSKLYLYNYNNYFNRIVKKESTLANYGTPIYSLSETNFDENDGVSANHVVNYAGFDGDYLIITKVINNVETIQSRWFVIENKKLRGGQHNLRLRRDLIVDYYDKIIKAPALINRAYINNVDDNLIFNSEGFNFNQIKRNETLINQYGNNYGSYYALYFAKDSVGAGLNDGSSFPTISGSLNMGQLPYDIAINSPISSSVFKAKTYKNLKDLSYLVRWRPDTHWYTPSFATNYVFTEVKGDEDIISSYPNSIPDWAPDYLWIVEDYEESYPAIINSLEDTWSSFLTAFQTESLFVEDPISQSQINYIKNSDGKIIKDSLNNYYKVKIKINTINHKSYSSSTSAISTFVQGRITTSGMEVWGAFGDKAVEYNWVEEEVIVTLAQQPSTINLNYEIDFGDYYNTNAPYNVVIIPANEQAIRKDLYSDVEGGFITIQRFFKAHESTNSRILNEIMLKAGKWLLDVQLIPYFPNINLISSTPSYDNLIYIDGNYPNIYTNPSSPQFYTSTSGLNENDPCWWCYYVDNPSFEFNSTTNPKINGASVPNSIDYKIENECNFYRISSPNYNGSFDFNLAKNRGLKYINVDVTLRPYNPYFHINPNFEGLYGYDYNDARGLICQGDFSVPIITDQFKNYEIQNKNYQQMFNRQIENLDFEQSLQRKEAIFGATVGTIGAGLGGAIAGGKIGGVGGAIGGAIGGTIASAIGGAVDYSIMKERQAEQKDYTIDMYKYQLGNIKALPTTINKITPFTNNNKIYPVLEYYTCTDEEKEILLNYLTYKSMTINAIGSISDYLSNTPRFINCSLIRLEDIEVPTHEVNEIYDELLKGVYI